MTRLQSASGATSSLYEPIQLYLSCKAARRGAAASFSAEFEA